MRCLVAGGSGFVGGALVATLARNDCSVTVLSRKRSFDRNETGISHLTWRAVPAPELTAAVESADCIVNLAGEPVLGKRWTGDRKEAILKSRVDATRALVEAIARAKKKPSVMVNASAVGYYGERGEEELTERSISGVGFLVETCRRWESEALRATEYGVRVVMLRIGIVLGCGGGALDAMLMPFRMGLGGPVGSGRQWMSWIHLNDLVRMIEWAASNPSVSGVYNATAPSPVRMREFAGALGKTLRRPAFLPVPGVALKLLMGEMSQVILAGQKVLPKRALDAGFRFNFETLQPALEDLVGVRDTAAALDAR